MEDESIIRNNPKRLRPWGSFLDQGLPISACGESRLTWEQVVRVLRKHRYFLFVIVGGLTLLVALAALLMRNVYQPTARLEIDPLGGGIKTLQEIESPRAEADTEYLDTQVQTLQSDGLGMRVIRALHLDQSPEFAGKREQSNLSAAGGRQPQAASHAGGASFLQDQLDLADPTPAESKALQVLHKRLYVYPVRGSRIVEVSFAAHEPHLAQAVTNALVSQFIEQSYRNRYVTTMESSQWLSTQLNDLRRKMSESNRSVADYQKKYGLVESDDRDVPLAQLMGEVSRQLSDAQADRIQSEAFVRMIDAGQAETIPSLRDDVVYQNLLTHYADVRARLAQAQTVYGDENTNVKKIQSEANELVAEVDSERARLIGRVRTSFAAAQAREQMMMDSRERLREQMGDASSHLVEYRMLKNEAVANATLYNTLEARLREAGIYAGLRSGNIHVIDMAQKLNEPTSPHRTLIVSVGAALSAMLGIVLVFVRESFDNTVRIPDDIRSWIRLPALAVLPVVGERATGKSQPQLLSPDMETFDVDHQEKGGIPRILWGNPQSAEADAIRSLRTALLVPATGAAPQVVLVSSANGGEGKTTVAFNLANALAQQGKTCLIEGDLRAPSIEMELKLNSKSGLTEVLRGQAQLDEAFVSPNYAQGLTVLPIKLLPDNPADLLASEQMRTTLQALRQTFRSIVIDSPPIIPFSDALLLGQVSDAVILVSRYGSTTRRSIERCVELLAEVHAPVVGAVLNGVDFASADYHYFNYGYSWGRSGKKYEYGKRPTHPHLDVSPGPEPPRSRGAHA